VHKGANSGKACVAAPDTVATLLLEVLKKIQNERSVELLKLNVGGPLPKSSLGEREKEPKAISIGGDGASACMALLYQALYKKLLQQGTETCG
jgi:hypothetical protein